MGAAWLPAAAGRYDSLSRLIQRLPLWHRKLSAPQLGLSWPAHTYTHTQTHLNTNNKKAKREQEKYRGKMALFFLSSRKISRGVYIYEMGVWVFRFVPYTHTHTQLLIFDSFLLAGPLKVFGDPASTHTHTRNIIIRVYNLSARNPCVYVATSPLCPLIPPPSHPFPRSSKSKRKTWPRIFR